MATNGSSRKTKKGKSASPTPFDNSDWIGPLQGDPAPILYFSGARRWTKLGFGEKDLHAQTGWRFRCFSYYYIAGPKASADDSVSAWEYCQGTKDVRVFLDSGAHTFLAKTKSGAFTEAELDCYLKDYAEWIQRYPGRFDFTVNFDYQKNAPEVYRVLQALRKKGVTPIPVFHGDSSLDWIKRYADDGHKLIGLGKPSYYRSGGKFLRQSFYGKVFNLTEKLGLKCHGFAVSGSNTFYYPWYSLDSTSWLRASVRGAILYYDPDRRFLKVYHVSKEALANPGKNEAIHHLNPKVLEALKERLEKQGVDFEQLQQSSFWRCVYNIRTQMRAVEHPSRNHSNALHNWTPVL